MIGSALLPKLLPTRPCLVWSGRRPVIFRPSQRTSTRSSLPAAAPSLSAPRLAVPIVTTRAVSGTTSRTHSPHPATTHTLWPNPLFWIHSDRKLQFSLAEWGWPKGGATSVHKRSRSAILWT